MRGQSYPPLGLVLLGFLAFAPRVDADGGTLRLSQTIDRLHLAVFTSPTPPRMGPVDVSVLITDEKTGRSVLEGSLTVRATQGERVISSSATSELATNKLMRAAHLKLPEPGVWTIEVELQYEGRPVAAGFDLTLADPPPPWLDLALWLSWPVVVVGLFILHRRRLRRQVAGRQAL